MKMTLAAAISVFLTGSAYAGSDMVAMCEKLLLERLISPSTYARISAQESVTPMEPDRWARMWINTDYMRAPEFYRRAQALKNAGRAAKLYSVLIAYDSQNTFGALIRYRSTCVYPSDDDRPPSKEADLIIDGKTQANWAEEQLRN